MRKTKTTRLQRGNPAAAVKTAHGRLDYLSVAYSWIEYEKVQNLFWICIADAESCYVTASNSILVINPSHIYIGTVLGTVHTRTRTRRSLVWMCHRCQLQPGRLSRLQPNHFVAVISLLFLLKTLWGCTSTRSKRSKRSVKCVEDIHTRTSCFLHEFSTQWWPWVVDCRCSDCKLDWTF